MKSFIYETAIYDGALKNWRVLNLSTGTFYSNRYETQEEAEASLENGAERAGHTVIRVSRLALMGALNDYFERLPRRVPLQ